MSRTSNFSDPHDIIGGRIRDKREQWGMTPQQLAETINVTLNYLGEIERGRRPLTLPVAEALCQLFGITYDYLFLGFEHVQPNRIAERPIASECASRTALYDMVASLSDAECEDYLALMRDVRLIAAKAER